MKKTQSSYPKCALCLENEGFSLNKNKPTKQTLRVLHDVFDNKKFFMHFSPYQYYNHHLILNSWEHSPLKIDLDTLKVLLDFVEKYKFYSLGTNGDIPIVGGSILSHLHFQGGKGNFPIFDADFFYSQKFSSMNLQLLKWPVSTIRISSTKPKEIIETAFKIMDKWYKYQNKRINIFNTYSPNSRNNAVNLFVRWQKNKYELYILLRNNFTTPIFPNGIFNFRKETWNIKKENIGIIEVLGKAILPGRLEKEITKLVDFCWNSLDTKQFPKSIEHHKQWYENTFKEMNFESKQDCEKKIWNEIGHHFLKGLNQCGVFSGHQKEFIKFLQDI